MVFALPRARVGRALAATLLGAVSCSDATGGDEPPACLAAPRPLDCAPLYGLVGAEVAPTFQQVFENTLADGCGIAGCHAGSAPQGGLALDGIDAAYSGLVTAGRVTPGDIMCGPLVVRLETEGKPW